MGDSEAHITLVMKAKNLAMGEIGSLDKGLKNLKTGALDGLGIGMVGVAGAVGLLTGALVKGIAGAIDEQAQLTRLGAALKANVPAWNGDLTAVTDAVHARESLGFTDTALRDSMIKLIPATHNVSKALDYQQTAMDLARLKGISLEDASQALVKVEGGQYKMLKSLGIVLKDGATQTDALAAVQQVAMGQAAAYADTLAGKTEALSAKFDDLTENVGGLLIPALNDLADTALKVVDVFDMDSPTTFGDRLKVLGDIANGLNPYMIATRDTQKQINAKLHEGDKAAFDAAKSFDTYGETLADQRDPTKKLTSDTKALTSALKLSGQAALDLVNEMIDIRREDAYLFDSSRGPRTKGKKKPSFTSGAGIHHGAIDSANADGGWVGLHGPEVSLLGERGPEYVVPNHQLGQKGSGVTIQGVTESQLMDMVDRHMYFRLRRAGSGVTG